MTLTDRIIRLFSNPAPKTAEFTFSTNSYTNAGSRVIIDSSAPLSMKTTPTLAQVPKSYLEAAYKTEPTVFNAINKTAQLITAAGYRLMGDPKSVAFFTDFFNNIGTRGGELEWEELLSSIYRHQMVYGEAWNELIPAKRDKERIVDLDLIDPKKMDFAKDSQGKIVLDVNQNPVGYIESLPMEYTAINKYQPSKEVYLESNQIFFPPDRVAHYKLYTIGDGFYGIGLIEPSYQTITRKLNMEEALANAVNRTGFPRSYAKIGDANHEPTEELVQRTAEKMKDMNYLDIVAYPHWVEYGILEARRPEKLQEHLNYHINQIVTGTGLPKAHATGTGEDTNRATLNRQEYLMKLTLKDIVRRTLRVLHKKVIAPVALSNNVEPVRIVWGEISIEELDSRAKRLVSYATAGLITPDKNIEELIRKLEDLPEQSGNYAGKVIK